MDFVKKKKKEMEKCVCVAGCWLEARVLTRASCEKSGKAVSVEQKRRATLRSVLCLKGRKVEHDKNHRE